MDYKKIGKFIVELRKENKLTQEKLAEKLFVDRTTISKWELGENNINTEILIKMSKIFGITINEMILGERLNKDNVDVISDVTVNAIKKNVKFKKYLILSLCIIVAILISFLTYYFINNYNSIYVYEIEGENDCVSVSDGIMVVSRDKVYINLGNVNYEDELKIVSSKLYYSNNNKENVLYESNDLTSFYVSDYDNIEFKYDDLKYIISNLFLELKFNDDIESTLKLSVIKSYSNNNLFAKDNKKISQKEINDFNDEVPEYIRNKFKYKEDDNSYYYEQKKENIKIKQTYFCDSKVFVVDEILDDYIDSYTYSETDLTYSRTTIDGNVIEEFVYNMENNNCVMMTCNDDKIEHFKSEYLSRIKF